MNDNSSDEIRTDDPIEQDVAVDRGRRRFGTAGITGTAVLLSLPGKSAVAGWGSCSGSELASGNLSRTGDANPCGCSPGFWWNSNGQTLRQTSPTLASYPFTSMFNQVFGRNLFVSDTPFQNCKASSINNNSYAISGLPKATAQHAIAALLNAAFYGARYPVLGMQTPTGVISAFQSAFDGKKQGISAFVNRVDIYSTGVWCNGKNGG